MTLGSRVEVLISGVHAGYVQHSYLGSGSHYVLEPYLSNLVGTVPAHVHQRTTYLPPDVNAEVSEVLGPKDP